MAKKNAKIFSEYMTATLPSPEQIIAYTIGNEQSYEVKTFEVRVKTTMTVDEKAMFVDRVVNNCFSEDDDLRPEMRDVMFQITVLQMLTDVPVFTTKVDELDESGIPTENKIEIIDIDKTYNLCKCLNLYEKADVLLRSLLDELRHLVAEKIIFRQQRILMGEKKFLNRVKEDMENGVALINGIASQLTDTLSGVITNNTALSATSEFADRMKGVSDEQLLKTILGK